MTQAHKQEPVATVTRKKFLQNHRIEEEFDDTSLLDISDELGIKSNGNEGYLYED